MSEGKDEDDLGILVTPGLVLAACGVRCEDVGLSYLGTLVTSHRREGRLTWGMVVTSTSTQIEDLFCDMADGVIDFYRRAGMIRIVSIHDAYSDARLTQKGQDHVEALGLDVELRLVLMALREAGYK